MSTKSVNTDAAQVQPAGNAELGDVLQGMFRKLDGVDHNQPGYHHASGWNAALRQVMDVLRAQTFSAQAQPEALSETLESARWRNALVGLCDTDRIDTPEQAIANVKRRMRPMGLAQQQQQPVSGADGLPQAMLPARPTPEAPNAFGLGLDGYTGAQMLTYGRACAEAQRKADSQAKLSGNTGELPREFANREAGEGTFIDAAGTVWSRPTAYAYAMVCKARDKWQAKAEEARDSALGEAAQALAYRRNLLISQNIVNDIQEGVALYDICIDAVLSLQQNATSTDPDKPKRATPMGELVLQLFDALDEAMRLDKSPSAWKHNPAGTPAQRMEAWQKVHKLRAEIKEFLP